MKDFEEYYISDYSYAMFGSGLGGIQLAAGAATAALTATLYM